jgi:hypothetical protein
LARSAPFLVLAAAALLAGAVGLLVLRKKPPAAVNRREAAAAQASSATTEARPPVSLRAAGPVPDAAPAPAPPVDVAPALDERTLMTTLRELRGSQPNRTLELARDGNQRFPNSPDVAERSWFIVKSLSDLGRHDEARVEGRALVERYRDTRWAEDVYRHLFVNPPTHPSERGYGKAREDE